MEPSSEVTPPDFELVNEVEQEGNGSGAEQSVSKSKHYWKPWPIQTNPRLKVHNSVCARYIITLWLRILRYPAYEEDTQKIKQKLVTVFEKSASVNQTDFESAHPLGLPKMLDVIDSMLKTVQNMCFSADAISPLLWISPLI